MRIQVLQINSSLFSEQGASYRLSQQYIEGLAARHDDVAVTTRDLGSNPIPHLDAARLTAIGTQATERTPEQQRLAAEADAIIAELQAADIVVIGVPMYNFSVPSQLKAWFDHVARAGVTFRYTEQGPEGLVKGKKAVVFTTRGGLHKGQATDTEVPFVRTFLNFIGIEDVTFVYAEGLNMGDEHRDAGLAAARQQIQALVAA